MKTRGEQQYINMPLLAARFYNHLTNVRGVNQGFEEMALYVAAHFKEGNLLDVGAGPGRLLCKIHDQNPDLQLFGLDLSVSMLKVAKRNLQQVGNVDLRVGNISKTDYPADYFDGIVSSGSLYNWNNPVEGLNEVYRILKPGKCVYIFETIRDYDPEILKERLKKNLKGYSLFRKVLSKKFLHKQLRMTYRLSEFETILRQSDFKESFTIERLELGNLPVYVRMELKKEIILQPIS